jgi:hypothetical protein
MINEPTSDHQQNIHERKIQAPRTNHQPMREDPNTEEPYRRTCMRHDHAEQFDVARSRRKEEKERAEPEARRVRYRSAEAPGPGASDER